MRLPTTRATAPTRVVRVFHRRRELPHRLTRPLPPPLV